MLKYSKRGFSIIGSVAKAARKVGVTATETVTGIKVYEVPPLPYKINALEPVISEKIMDYHYNKHHHSYVRELNAGVAMATEAMHTGATERLAYATKFIKFAGGGHINHCIFWTNLAPKSEGGGELPKENTGLYKAVTKQWGSFDKLITDFNNRTVLIQGSGWGWLAYNTREGALQYLDRSNQDPVSLEEGMVPVLGIDVWEHAYYIQYKNERAKYLEEIWKVVNWQNVAERFDKAVKESPKM